MSRPTSNKGTIAIDTQAASTTNENRPPKRVRSHQQRYAASTPIAGSHGRK